jgi:hypothetical protein
MMSFKSHISFHFDGALRHILIRRLSQILLIFVLILPIVGSPLADTPTPVDGHLDTLVAQSVNDLHPTPACDPELACSAFVLPVGPATDHVTEFALVVRLILARQHRGLTTPFADTPPPRSLT